MPVLQLRLTPQVCLKRQKKALFLGVFGAFSFSEASSFSQGLSIRVSPSTTDSLGGPDHVRTTRKGTHSSNAAGYIGCRSGVA
jgi:hypothetical protein